MKACALLFAWVLVVLVYAPNGNISETPVFWTMLLIGVAIEICESTFHCASRLSSAAIEEAYVGEMIAAYAAGDACVIERVRQSLLLFRERGAA